VIPAQEPYLIPCEQSEVQAVQGLLFLAIHQSEIDKKDFQEYLMHESILQSNFRLFYARLTADLDL